MASTDARPVPRKNVAYRVTFPLLDAEGDLVTGAAGLDSEVSLDGGTFADCTNEATEIATSSGMYYLDLTAAEMNADTIAIIVKTTTTGAKTTPIVMYPEEVGDYRIDSTALTAIPWNAAWDAEVQSEAADALTAYDPPTNTEMEARTLASASYGTAANQATIATYIDTEVAAIITLIGTPAGVSVSADIAAVKTETASILTDTAEIGAAGAGLTALASQASLDTLDNLVDTEVAAIKAVTDKLDTAVELDGAVYRYTTNALELAPAGSGLDAAGVRAAVGLATANLDTQIGTLATAANLATVDTVVDAIKVKTDALPSGITRNEPLANFEFLMVQSADHISAATGLTVTAQRSLDGAAFAACANLVAEVGSGVYKIDFAATDLDGAVITFLFTAATADARVITLTTEPA